MCRAGPCGPAGGVVSCDRNVGRRPSGWRSCVCCSAAAAARGQTVTSASVTGIVRDSSGLVVPGVTVDIRNHATNQVSQAVTDARRPLPDPVSAGRRLPSVGAAARLHHGEREPEPRGRRSDRRADRAQARRASPSSKRSSAPRRWSRRGAPSWRPRSRRARSTACRSTAGTISISRCSRPTSRAPTCASTDRFAETSAIPGTGVSVAGQRNLNNNFVVDGLSANDDAADLAGMYLSQEVVREFEVVTSGGGAEFGRASSGTISVVTQSGTNRNGGRAYEFFRNDRFDEQNPLAIRKDPLNQNQFGLHVRRSDRPRPDVLVRQRRAHAAGSHRHRHDRAGVGERGQRRARLRPAIGGPRITTGNFPTGYTSTNGFVRVDHQAAAGPRLQVRYNVYNVTSANARNVSGLSDVSRGAALDDTDQTAAASLLTARSSGMINEVRAQYTHSRLGAPVNDIDRPGGRDRRRRQLRHRDLVADRARHRRLPGGRHRDDAARIASAEDRRRPALQPDQHHVPGRAAGQLHLHVAAELSARHLLAVSAGVRRAVAAAVESEPGAVRAGRMAACAAT